MDQNSILQFALPFASSNPKIASILMIIGGFRVFFKPLMTCIESMIQASGNQKLQGQLDVIEKGPIYKAISFVLDYGFSIKSPAALKKEL